nr:MAG TPA: protein of unknown function (DUF202) [Caudoviricetes sp.]
MRLNSCGDAKERTLLAWVVNCASATFMLPNYAGR